MTFKILYATDLHGNKKLYEKLLDKARDKSIKAVIIGGDICPRDSSSLTIEDSVKSQKDFIESYLVPLFDRFRKENKKEIFIMMGNDDFAANMKSLENAEKKGILKLMHNKLNKVNGHNIVGYSFCNEMPFLLKDWEKLDDEKSKQLTDPKQDVRTVKKAAGTIKGDMEKLKKLSDPKKTVYVIHCPPFDSYLDVINSKKSVGSRAVREFIEKEQPPLTLHGHIHESPIAGGEYMEKIGKTICINPGSEYLDGMLNVIIIDLDNLEDIEHDML